MDFIRNWIYKSQNHKTSYGPYVLGAGVLAFVGVLGYIFMQM